MSAFDGQPTTSIEFGNSANIHLGRYEPSQVFPPHTWGMVHLEVNFPLSVFLRGTDAMRQHRKVRRLPVEHGSVYEFYKAESEFAEEEQIGDLMCVRIRCKRWYYTQGEPAIQYLWLAPERNYLCVKTQERMPIEGSDLPISQSLVEEFREIEPDMWLPVRVRSEHYDYEQLRQNRLVVDRTQSLVVEKAVLSPKYPLRKFRSTDIPDGLPTYTIGQDGELKDSPLHPRAAAEQGTTKFEQIIERIRENEQLYANLDLSLEAAYRKDGVQIFGGGRAAGGQAPSVEYARYEAQARTLSSGGKIYYQEEKSNHLADATNYVARLTAAFDGQWTRTRSEDDRRESNAFQIAWASLEKANNTPGYRPHTMALGSRAGNEALSQMLTSEWSDRRNRNRQVVEYEGDNVIDGLLCHRIRVDTLLGDDGRLYASRFVWLAKDRNLLPMRNEWHEPRWSQTLPTGVTIASDLREVKQGVWFPYHVTSLKFETGPAGLCENRLIVSWREDYRVQNLTLDPQPDPALFTTVKVPRGTKINVRDEDGKFVCSRVQEEDGNISLSNDK